MTTPVEADVHTEQGTMRFFVGKKDYEKAVNAQQVQVKEINEQQVLAISIRGSYTKEQYKIHLCD